MAFETMLAAELPCETNPGTDEVPSVPPSAAVALAIAVFCGLFAYGQSAAVRDLGPVPAAGVGSAADECRPAAWTGGTGRFDGRTVADLAIEGWNAGAAEEACL